jgi:uncharacterized protein (TIGR02391 family)
VNSANAKALLTLARELQVLAAEASPPRSVPIHDAVAMLDAVVIDPELMAAARKLFVDGHYSRAVEEGYKLLNNIVKRRSGLASDGATLMTSAISPGAPLLKLSPLRTQSQRDQQQGYMRILEGSMIGIRNPRAHEHAYLDDPRNAVELLAWCNHLIRVVKSAKRTRRR